MCVRICKISCMSSGDDDNLDGILVGPVADKLVAMTELSQQPGCSKNLLGVIPPPTNDASSTAELPPCEGRTGELRGGGPCQGPGLSLADALPRPQLCIIVKNAGILFTPSKIYTRKLSIDVVSPKT